MVDEDSEEDYQRIDRMPRSNLHSAGSSRYHGTPPVPGYHWPPPNLYSYSTLPPPPPPAFNLAEAQSFSQRFVPGAYKAPEQMDRRNSERSIARDDLTRSTAAHRDSRRSDSQTRGDGPTHMTSKNNPKKPREVPEVDRMLRRGSSHSQLDHAAM